MDTELRAAGGGRESEVRSLKPAGGGQRAEVGSPTSDLRPPTSDLRSPPSAEPAHIQARLLEYLRGVFSAEVALTEETDLLANGFDSLSLVSLLVFIEQTYGLWLPQEEINEANLKNIRALAAVVLRQLHDRPLPS